MDDFKPFPRLEAPARKKLGVYLAAAARARNQSGRLLADALGWNTSKVSRVLTGKAIKTEPYYDLCLQLEQVWDEALEHASELATHTGQGEDTNTGAENMGPRIITVCAEKGGVGKTTLSVNLAVALHDMGFRTLFVDLDGQANGSAMMLGGYPEDRGQALHDAINSKTEAGLPIVSTEHGPDLVPSGDVFSTADQFMGMMMGAGLTRITKLLEPILKDYDRIVLDTAPKLGPLVSSALKASTDVIIPAKPSGFSIDGVYKTLETCRNLREDYGAKFVLRGVVLLETQRTNITDGAKQQIEEMEVALLEPQIPRAVAFLEADAALVPAIRHEKNNAAVKQLTPLFVHLESLWNPSSQEEGERG